MQTIPTIRTEEDSSTMGPFTRRDFLSTSLKAGAAAFTMNLFSKLPAKAAGAYNVLFIMVDDLRPLLGCYGHPEMHTPNIDALAQRGTLFNRAYCQYPLSNPTRASIFAGLRPDTTNVRVNSTFVRNKLPDMVTLFQHFKEHGYHTQSLGKIAYRPKFDDDDFSWSVPSWRPVWRAVDKPNTPSWRALKVRDSELSDGKIADRAVKTLEVIKDRQFFLGVGFRKPHFPLEAPQKYFDLYNPDTFNLPASLHPPQNAPQIALTNWNSIREFQDLPSGKAPISEAKILEITHAYVASISFIDAQIGYVLKQLDTLGLTKSTVILFCGDHGHHLGEHGILGKDSLFEVSLHSPLIVSIPGQLHTGTKTDALVEFVDIYPTLCEACQLPIRGELEGFSAMPIIQQPTLPWKTGAFSQLRRAGENGNSIRTQRYRYTEWGIDGRRGIELYDYEADPDETLNVADLLENTELVARLSEQLHAGWQSALPDRPEQTSVRQTLPWDINSDGIIDSHDLVLVSENYGTKDPAHPKVDVNKDGAVDIVDLLIVAAHFGESGNLAAPSTHIKIPSQHLSLVEQWIAEALSVDDGSHIFRHGVAALERILNNIPPETTTLLPNYPNPFNPETWIPYDLAADADIHIHIYNLKGESIRQLSVGFQTSGVYRTRDRAAYWDGRNELGEAVASGVYFYTLTTGDFTATRKMLIRK